MVNLIRGRRSKKILYAICSDQPIDSTRLPKEISPKKLEELRALYQEKNQGNQNSMPSLLSLMVLDLKLEQRYPCLKILPKPVITELENLFRDIQIIYPNNEAMKPIAEWLHQGLLGNTLYTFSMACPDYSVEQTGDDPQCPFRHTFNSVGINS